MTASKQDLPDFTQLLIATIESIKNLGGSASNDEIVQEVISVLNVSDEVAAVPHGSGRSTYLEYRLFWARTYLKKVGAIDNTERGVWTITPVGRDITEAEIAEVRRKVRTINAEARRRRATEASDDDVEEENDEDWTERLLSVLGLMPPDAFERLCQRLLREAGFTKVEVTGKSGDGGIDGIGVLRVRLVSFQVLFQCKRWKGSVGAAVIRDFRGAMVGRADKGLVMTTGTFTADARREATRDGAPAIDLVDGEDLCGLLKELKIGVAVKLVEEVEINEKVFAEI